jgi:hypothetical protein
MWLALSMLAVTGCERGCVREWTGGDGSLGKAATQQQDCPTGMARCVEGAVEVAEGRAPCPTCLCSWRRVLGCDAGCAAEQVELARDPLEPATFCRSSTNAFAALPPAKVAPARCPADARFLCHGGLVFACPPSSDSVAVNECTFGCEREDESLDEPSVDIGAATLLMCRRTPHADSGVANP